MRKKGVRGEKTKKPIESTEVVMIRKLRFILRHGDEIALRSLSLYLDHLYYRASAAIED